MNKSKQYKRIEWITVFVILMMVVGGMVQTASASSVNMRFAVGSDLHREDNATGGWITNTNNFIGWMNNESNSSLGLNYIILNGDLEDNPYNASVGLTDLRDNYFNRFISPYHANIGNHDSANLSTGAIVFNSSQWNGIWGYQSDNYFVDGNYLFIFLNFSSTYHIANASFLQAVLDSNPSKKAFVFIHVAQVESIYGKVDTNFQNIISNHSNVVAVFSGHDHEYDYCSVAYGNATKQCWDGHANAWGSVNGLNVPYFGYRVVEAYNDGAIITYEMDGKNQTIQNMDVLSPKQTYYNNSGLVLYNKFNESNGTPFAFDSSGNNLGGVLQGNNPENWTTGYYGNGLNMSSPSTEYVDYGSPPLIQSLIQNFTVEAWVKFNSFSPTGNWLITKGLAYKESWTIGSYGNTLRVYGSNDTVNWNYLAIGNAAGNVLTSNTAWYHVAFTLDNSSGTHDGMYVYLNGVQIDSTSTNVSTHITADYLRTGRFGNSPDLILDELRIYNRSLTHEQISQDFNASSNYPSHSGIYMGHRLNNTVYPNGTIIYSPRIINSIIDIPVTLTANPSSNLINITISAWNTTGDYRKVFTASSNTHINPTVYTIGDFPTNTPIQVNKNGVFDAYYLSNGSGFITFTHSTYSDLTIEAFLLPSPIEVATCPGVNSDINTAFGLIGVLLIVFAAGMLISGIRSMNYLFMIVGIGAAIIGAIMIIVGYFITVTVSNGVGCLG